MVVASPCRSHHARPMLINYFKGRLKQLFNYSIIKNTCVFSISGGSIMTMQLTIIDWYEINYGNITTLTSGRRDRSSVVGLS